MRINKYIALATGMSRRAADQIVAAGRITVNGNPGHPGLDISDADKVMLDSKPLVTTVLTTILINKPVGYVVSRDGQGSRTIYELLPDDLQHLKPVGRLDKNSSGLLLMTNDGTLANELTHPRYSKQKVYEITLDKPLQPLHRQMIQDHGVVLEDGVSRFQVDRQGDDDFEWKVTMHEGRNRQIRRTFNSLGYDVTRLHRTHFGTFMLGEIKPGTYKQ